MNPVLYLDIDDTLLTYADGRPRAAEGAGAFLRWALARYEVRWLTRWCPSGEMPGPLLHDLCRMLEMEPDSLAHVRGCDWRESGIKVDGIAWVEHVAVGRPFLWIEDERGLTDRDRAVLETAGHGSCYQACDVTREAGALRRLHERLSASREPGTGGDEALSRSRAPGSRPEDARLPR